MGVVTVAALAVAKVVAAKVVMMEVTAEKEVAVMAKEVAVMAKEAREVAVMAVAETAAVWAVVRGVAGL